jgi:hypothetical protein
VNDAKKLAAMRDVERDAIEREGEVVAESVPPANDASEPPANDASEPPPPPVPAVPWSPIRVPAGWFNEAPPRRRYLLRDARVDGNRGVLPMGKVGAVVAEGGTGKTMINVQLAVAVSTGTPWLGAITVDPEAVGRVLLVLGEEDEEEAHRRLYNAGKSAQVVPPSGAIDVLPLAGIPSAFLQRVEHGALAETAFLGWLRTYVKEHGPFSLIVLDPLSRFAGPDAETENASGTRFVQACESLAGADTTVLVAHHSNKMARGAGKVVGTDAARGSSSLTDGFRWVATMGAEDAKVDDPVARSRLGKTVRLRFTKSNYSVRGDDIELRHQDEHGGALVPLDDMDVATLERARYAPVLARAAAKDREADDAVTRDAARVAGHVLAHPGETIGNVRALTVKGNAVRWTGAVAKLGKALLGADVPRGATASLTLDEGAIPADVAAAMEAANLG